MTTDLSYDDAPPQGGGRSIKWSAVGLAGKHGLTALFSILLARIVGPDSYGLVAQALVYITLTTLLLDQGIAAALVSVSKVSRRTVGAVSSLNILLAVGLALATFFLAPLIAAFFRSPPLTEVLQILGVGLLFKGLAIVPRMMHSRALNFRMIALSDLVGAVAGGSAGLILALLGSGYWGIVTQTLVMDAVAALLLILTARPPRPNLHLGLIRPHLAFSLRVFGSNMLSYVAGNADSALIGRYLGATQLAAYDIAYRFLRLPVDMTAQILNRVLFPLVASKRHRGEAVGPTVLRSLRGISFFTFPMMAVIGASSTQLVELVLGESWRATIPILAVFAFSGARQSITTVNTPIMLGLGKVRAQLWFSTAAAIVQVGAIVIGLSWGALGVAWGYTLAGLLLTPVIAAMQKRFSGVGYRSQLMSIVPAAHGAFWSVAAYWLVANTGMNGTLLRFVLGVTAAVAVYGLVVTFVHRATTRAVIRDVALILGRRVSSR